MCVCTSACATVTIAYTLMCHAGARCLLSQHKQAIFKASSLNPMPVVLWEADRKNDVDHIEIDVNHVPIHVRL